MQKLARTSLQIAWPLTVIGFKRHARQIQHLVWIIRAAHDMHRHGQKTEEDMDRKHFTQSDGHDGPRRRLLRAATLCCLTAGLSFPSSHGHMTFTVVRWCWQTSTRLSTSAYTTNQTVSLSTYVCKQHIQ